MTAGSSSPSAGSSGKAATQFKSGNSFSFRPGTSGNPSGRSKLLAEVETLALSYSKAAIERLHHLVHNARSERVQVAAATVLLDRGLGRAPVKLIDSQDRPVISEIRNLIVSPDGQVAEIGGLRSPPTIDHEAVEDAELVTPDRPAEAEGPGPEGETSRVDLHVVMSAVARAQAAVAENRRELGQASAALQASGQRLRQVEAERRAREARTRPNGSADDNWY